MGLFKRPSGASPPHSTPSSSTSASPFRTALSTSSTGASTASLCTAPTSMPANLRSPPPIAPSTAPAASSPSATPSRRRLRVRTTSHSQGHSISGANISYPSSPLAFEHLPPSPLPHIAAATPASVPAASITPKRVRLKSGGVSFQEIVPLTPLSPSTPAGRLNQGKIAAGPPESPKTPLQQPKMVHSSQHPVGDASALATRRRQRTNDTPRLITRKAPPTITPSTPYTAHIAPLESLSRSRTATSSTSTSSSSSAGHAYRGFANSLPRPKMVRRASSMDDIRTPVKLAEKKRAQTQSISVHSAPHSRAASTQTRFLAPPALPFMTKLGSGSAISSSNTAAATASESSTSSEQRRRQRTLTCGQPSLSGMTPPGLSGSATSSVTSSPVQSQIARCQDLALPLVLQSTAAKDMEEMYSSPVLPQGPLFTTDFFYPSSSAGSPEFAQLARFPSSVHYTNDKTLIYAASAVQATLAPAAPSTNLAKFDYAPSSTMSDVERLTSATRFAGMGFTSSRGQTSRNASATSSANGSYGSSHPSSPGSLSPNRSRKTSRDGKLGAFSSASSNASSSFSREQDSWRAFLDYDRSLETSVEDTAKVAKEDKKLVLALELMGQAGASRSLAQLPIDTENVLTLKGDKAHLEDLNVTVVHADRDGEAVWEIRIGRSVPETNSIAPVELISDKSSQVSVPSPTPFTYASSIAASTTDCTSPPSSAPSTPSLQVTAAMELAGSYFMPLSPPQTALKTPKKTTLSARQACNDAAEAALEVGTLPAWSVASAKAAVGKRSRQSSTRTTRASVGARSRQTTMATHGSYGSTPASPTVALSSYDFQEGRARHAEQASKAHLAAKAKLELLSLWSARAYSNPPDAPESDADDDLEQSLQSTDDEDGTADILRHYRGTASPALGRSVPSPRTWRFKDASTTHIGGGQFVHDKVFEADELSLVGRQGWSETEPEAETDFDADTDAEVSVA